MFEGGASFCDVAVINPNMMKPPLPNIATGGYANVYRADDAITGTSYVLKRMTVFKDNLLVAGCAR